MYNMYLLSSTFFYTQMLAQLPNQLVWEIRVMVKVFNVTFNNCSVISWWSILLVEETGVPGENHRPAASH